MSEILRELEEFRADIANAPAGLRIRIMRPTYLLGLDDAIAIVRASVTNQVTPDQ